MSDPKKDAKRDVIRRRIFMKNVPDFAEKAGLEIGTFGYRCILRNNCILVCFSNNVKIRHGQGLHIIWLL